MISPDNGLAIRLTIVQPGLPKYRLPVHRELAKRPGIRLTYIYAEAPNLTNVAAEGFDAQFVSDRRAKLLGQEVCWYQAQWRYADRRFTDVLVLYWNARFLSLVPALLRARAQGIPTILWGMGFSIRENRWYTAGREAVARLATALLFYDEVTAQRFLQAGWPRERIFVAQNTLDQTPIQEARRYWLEQPRKLEAFQREKALKKGPRLIFVSRLLALNRIDLIISAAGELVHDYPDLEVILIGKGEDEARLRALAEALGIAERVRFVGAIYDEMELAPWFLSSQVFCYPATVGLGLHHAFGYGLPAVAGDNFEAQGAEVRALRHGENGLLFKHGDVPSLCGALRQLFDDPAAARIMGEEARRTVTERYSIVKMVDGMEQAVRYCTRRARG